MFLFRLLASVSGIRLPGWKENVNQNGAGLIEREAALLPGSRGSGRFELLVRRQIIIKPGVTEPPDRGGREPEYQPRFGRSGIRWSARIWRF